MLGAIAGDIIGSVYEHKPLKSKDFPLFKESNKFTDDSVMTIAIANAILNQETYFHSVKTIGKKYPDAGYGGNFIHWLLSDATEAYNSFGNGAGMRVSPVGFAFPTQDKVLKEARKTAEITHNHEEGIKGAQAIAIAVFLAFNNSDKETIRHEIKTRFNYNLHRTLDHIRPEYQFNVTCQGSVPEAIIAFLESTDVEDAIRNAVSLGGDSDTLACMTGSIAHAFYKKVPENITQEVRERLPQDLLSITDQFLKQYQIPH